MKTTRAAWMAFAAVAIAAMSAQAVVGDPAPEFESKDCVGVHKALLKALRGHVVACLVFRTTHPDVEQRFKELDGLTHRTGRTFVLALTDESRAAVDAFAEKTLPTVPIVIVGGDTAKSYGLDAAPEAFVIDPEGKIAWASARFDPVGNAPELIDALERKARDLPYVTGKLAPFKKLYDDAKPAEARAKFNAVAANASSVAADREAAALAVEFIDFESESALHRARQRERRDGCVAGVIGYRGVVDSYKGLDAARQASAALAAIAADPVRKKEVAAYDEYRAVVEKYLDLVGSAWRDKATPADKITGLARLRTISRTYPDAEYGKLAAKTADELEKERVK